MDKSLYGIIRSLGVDGYVCDVKNASDTVEIERTGSEGQQQKMERKFLRQNASTIEDQALSQWQSNDAGQWA